MNNYDELVKYIIENVGGAENIGSATHCATRLRLKLVDTQKVKKDKLDNNKLILGTVERGTEIQLIIGPDVPKVYSIFNQQTESIKKENASIPAKKSEFSLKKIGSSIVDFVSGTFVPVLPVLVAAGLVSAVLNICVTFFGLFNESGTYVVLNAINDAGFYFLPIYIGYSAARKLGINSIMGMFLGGILVHNTINGIEGLSFLNISIPQVSYNTTTIPVIFGVLFMALIDKTADRFIPQAIKYFFKPLIVILITVPVTLIILGPLGNTVGSYIASDLSFMYENLGWFSVGIIGAVTPLLVMTGTNQALFPLVFAMMAEFNYDSFVMPGMLAANTAVGAAALGIFFVEKNIDKKSLALSSGITGVMGITEPAIFGVLLNYRSAFLGAIIGGGAGGIFAGLVSLKQYAVVSPGLAAIPTFIPTDGAGLNSNFWFSIVTIVISVGVSLGATVILQRRRLQTNKIELAEDAKKIFSPLKGQVVSLETVNDEMFSKKILGDGIAINPSDGILYAPVDGLVVMTTTTNHAIGIRTNDGVELLMHVGIDTVTLNGEYMETLVNDGSKVRKGTPLIRFDLEEIKGKGIDLITPVIVTNSAEYKVFSQTIQNEVNEGDYIFSVG
ncbi:glucose PTS transporter subunit IIA [Enterococcus pallens]|uniref:PTS system, beta-glucoside-specific IIABC component n=1 Tax=Enterococcus pallens ATCC BAA-351 TaxID=1158607 RepID=R2Q487_9ENTE|nr:glucose PTS transporter subunit IIA [Enterococcus pallens]EOH91352.1 PTS system, beta-glucoside-specific IIABC component [Enterococcus pallens ATCC BAA-351]EOU15970.1 hypothetical protein I588_03626 [Enterococcus pallens ATCC BAA-351]OJG78306.1 PTS system, beta-glucoside-specific IIABC component [Enterococcus pallens]